MRVKAGKDLSFICQGKKVSDILEINVVADHDILSKIREGSLIDMASYREPVVIVPKVEIKTKPVHKTVNKEK